jgi:predicted nucleotidyltransferase
MTTVIDDLDLTDLTIFATGSYARLEASEHSDIDLFFCYDGRGRDQHLRRTNELKMFGRLIELVERQGFPRFSKDAEYLRTHDTANVLALLGKRDDDWHNHFTMRILMLLESKSLIGHDTFNSILRQIVHAYYNDYPGHETNFRPWFLVNDIMRFWKTLLLNYESNRPLSEEQGDYGERVAHKVRNFKLKYSRMTTCFATVAAIGSHAEPVHEDDVIKLVTLTPTERLRYVGEHLPETRTAVDAILEEYVWFLSRTALPKEELHALFVDRSSKTELFGRATAYGQLMFELLKSIDAHTEQEQGFLRYLVV